MRSVLSLILLSLSLHSSAQEAFTARRWSTNTMIGLKDFTFSSRPVDIVLDTLNRKYPYGYITEFFADQQFISYNVGPCGNECRMKVKGNYTITQDTIDLFVSSISYAKDCKNRSTEEVNARLGRYQWKQNGTRLLLKPIETN